MLLTPDLHETLVATAKKSITEPYKLPLDSFAADPEDIKDSGCARCLMVAVTCPNCKEYVAPKAVAAHFASKSHLRTSQASANLICGHLARFFGHSLFQSLTHLSCIYR